MSRTGSTGAGWVWCRYDEHGPWDTQLGDSPPTHGWRRELEVIVGDTEWMVTEWHFGPTHPEHAAVKGLREINVIDDQPGDASVA